MKTTDERIQNEIKKLNSLLKEEKLDGRKYSSEDTNKKKQIAAKNTIRRLRNKKRVDGIQERIDRIVARNEEKDATALFYDKGHIFKNRRMVGRLAGR